MTKFTKIKGPIENDAGDSKNWLAFGEAKYFTSLGRMAMTVK